MEGKAYRFDAFISYRHREMDMAIAKRLQHLLENHKKPDGTALRVFRDQSELPTNSDLGQDINRALEESRFLIILCSRTYCESKYCMAELTYFRRLHNGSNRQILVMLLEGEPDEVFPDEVRTEQTAITLEDGTTEVVEREIEPLAADVREKSIRRQLKKLRTEYLRIAAPVLGCGFDDLYQRAERKRRARILTAVSIVAALAVALSVYSMYMLNQIAQRQRKLEQKQAELYANESRRLANESMEIAASNPNLALLLADTAMPDHLDEPEYPVQAEAETALRSAALNAKIQQHDQGIRLNAVIDIEGTLGAFYDQGNYLVTKDHNHTRVYDARTAALLTVMDQTDILFSADMSRYYCRRETLAESAYQVDVDVFDTFSGERVASYEVIRETEYVLNTMFLDERTGRLYVVRWYSGSDEVDSYGYIDAQDCFVQSDELPEDAKARTYYGRQQGNTAQRCDFEVTEDTVVAEIQEQLGSAYSVDALMSTWDGCLYLAELSVWKEYGTFDYQDDAAFSILDAVEASEDARVEHHPQNVPQDYFGPYVENGVERNRIYDSSVEGTFTVYVRNGQQNAIWDVASRRVLRLVDGECFQYSKNKLLYCLVNQQLKVYSYYPESSACAQIDDQEQLGRIAADGTRAGEQIDRAIEGEDPVYSMPRFTLMSADGKRVAAAGQQSLEIFDTEDLLNPLFYADGIRAYTLTDDFAYALVHMPLTEIRLYETQSGKCLFAQEISQNSQTATCVNEDGTQVAVATPLGNRAWRIDVYQVADGEVIRTFEMVSDDAYGPYMEFSGKRLCVAFYGETWIYDLDNPENPVRYETGEYAEGAFTEGLPVSAAFRGNGLIVVPGLETSAYGTRYRVNAIIDPQSGKTIPFYSRYDAGVESYYYDDISDTLIDQETDEFIVQRRNASGAYEEVYRIAAQGECRQIFLSMQVCDGEYFVVNGTAQTEIYRIADGTLQYLIPHGGLHTPYYVIADGVLYDMNSQNERIVSYPLPDTQQARAWTREYLAENGARRRLTDMECKAYYVPSEWQ